jgi:tRNA threonylcarbamoyladenosine biosynthesis protein TsaE
VERNYSLNELNVVAKEVIKNANFKVLLFEGTMGVGKTTLIKEIAKELGVLDVVSSPTFSLVNEYHTQNNDKVYHFDFYRIEDEEEALDIGIEEYFYSGCWCLVEWPLKIKNLLPLESVLIRIITDKQLQRTIQLTNNE